MTSTDLAYRPIVALPADTFARGLHPFHGVGEKYINAVLHGANALPVLLPGLGEGEDLKAIEQIDFHALVRRFDGICIPGSASNLDPKHYDKSLVDDGSDRDHQRDDTTLPLIQAALDEGVPILAICRGFQELNVVCGGTLHQAVHDLEGFMDHREDKTLPRSGQYAKAHKVRLADGGLLHAMVNEQEVEVNSIHGQGINRLGDGLQLEATAPDGLIEAFSVPNAKSFALAVQWHPEWEYHKDVLSTAIFTAFGQAVAQRASQRT